MNKFTGGEWEYDTHSIKAITPEETVSIAFIYQPNTKEEAEANACLIAHAPEMFKLLQYIAVTLAHDTGYSDICSIIHKLLRRIDNTPAENEPEAKLKYCYSFSQNRDCEYFPCHAGNDTETFSCLFCFCPLYHMQECPGNPTYLPSGIKDCSNCTLPHRNYNRVISELRKEKR